MGRTPARVKQTNGVEGASGRAACDGIGPVVLQRGVIMIDPL